MRANTPNDVWKKYRVKGTCWIWTGKIHPHYGYGLMLVSNKQMRVHRLAWIATHGEIPKGMLVCHKCDVRACINPEHLYLGDQKQNTRDAIERNRISCGERHYAAKLTAADVVSMREKRSKGASSVDLATNFGVSQKTVTEICRFERWKHIGGPSYKRMWVISPLRNAMMLKAASRLS